MREIDALPARWSIYRASEAAELAGLLALDVRDMRRYLDPAVVKTTSKPIVVIRHSENPRHISFCAFLPNQRFADVWELSKLVAADFNVRYWLKFDFIGFIPRKVADHPEAIGYDDWLAGRPCVLESFACSNGIDCSRHEPDGRPKWWLLYL